MDGFTLVGVYAEGIAPPICRLSVQKPPSTREYEGLRTRKTGQWQQAESAPSVMSRYGPEGSRIDYRSEAWGLS